MPWLTQLMLPRRDVPTAALAPSVHHLQQFARVESFARAVTQENWKER
jgi:hypothetical protein